MNIRWDRSNHLVSGKSWWQVRVHVVHRFWLCLNHAFQFLCTMAGIRTSRCETRGDKTLTFANGMYRISFCNSSFKEFSNCSISVTRSSNSCNVSPHSSHDSATLIPISTFTTPQRHIPAVLININAFNWLVVSVNVFTNFANASVGSCVSSNCMLCLCVKCITRAWYVR